MRKSDIKVGFVSLGCPKNQLDTEVMLAHIAQAGYTITPEESEADVVIVNTCAFIESAKQEAIDNILDVAWLKDNANLKALIVTGCLPERYREELLTEMPEIDAVLGVGSIHHITEAIEAALAKSEKYARFDDKEKLELGGDRVITTGDAYAYLKISEGCNNRCAYCAIPYIRGNMRSRTVEDIVAEAKTLDEMGIKELILVAQDTSAYGFDLYGEYALPRLIRAITDATEIPWIRLLYCYPDKITPELVAEMAQNDRVVKYIDIPLQHASDPVLSRMNRHGDSSCIKDAIHRLRDGVPGIVLRTTFITGFPGETEQDFEALCRFVKEEKFECVGVFPYSREEGTPAYDMPDQIDAQTAQNRADILMATQAEISESWKQSFVGKTEHILCEGYDVVAEAYFGRTRCDAPEIDGKVYFTSPAGTKYEEGEMVDVKITAAMDYDLVGETIL
ncbi:MAG: 30S ribosomal protein S12 methylthiotransferase RimO [Clostridia bacterium]|nr:30S ribosomal protein S12 methylthiotransferase RimO [Clostridia bacterium]